MSATKPEQEFREFLASGRFMIQRSRSTGGYVFYPRVAEPGTGATDLEWVEASGRGTVHSYTVVAQNALSRRRTVAAEGRRHHHQGRVHNP